MPPAVAVLTKNEKTREILHPFGGAGKEEALFVLFERKNLVIWSLALCCKRERERERERVSGQKTLSFFSLSKKERVVD